MERAIKEIGSRQIYAPYFKARWQNLQNIINDSVFYSMIKEPYLTYYQAYIRQWQQWASGFVPMLHRGDFFATGMGYTVCEIFARECMGGGYRFDSADKGLQSFMQDWAKEDLDNVLAQMFFFANAGGNALLTLTPVDGEVHCGVVPINRAVFEIGRGGEVTQATILNRFMAGEKSVYAKESRIVLNGVGYYKVDIAEQNSIVTSPSWNSNYLKAVPEAALPQWKNTYGNIEPSVWYKLPSALRSLGVYNVKNKAVAVALSDLAGYSDSTLHTALDVLYAIDYNYTQLQLDQYWGRTRVIIPKRMQRRSITSNAVNISDGVSFVEAVQSAPLSEDIFTEVPNENSLEGDPLKPFFMQPDLRGEAHKYIRDADLELLASKVGLSSSTLANHLTYNTSKTATEVRGEQDTTETSINNKRALANVAINRMLADVAAFYGFTSGITINWNRSSVNSAVENSALLADYQAGTLPLREYLKRRWRDLTDEDIAEWIRELDSDAAKQRDREYGDFIDKMVNVNYE